MKNILLYSLLLVSLIISSCQNTETESSERQDSINKEIVMLKGTISEKEKMIEEYIKTFNEIHDNLDSIKNKQNIITEKSKSGASLQDEISMDIQQINSYLLENNKKMNYLNNLIKSKNSSIKDANSTNENLLKMNDRLKFEMELRDMELGDLRNYLTKLNLKIEDLNASLNEKTKENTQKTAELNTAYYAIGTAKELRSKGIITKEGGFIGLGKSYKMNDDFKKSSFNFLNITNTKKLDINSKHFKIVTTHPEGTYKVNGTKNYTESIEILYPKDFWGASKYLVIILDN